MGCDAKKGEDGGSKVFQNIGILPQHYPISQPRRLWHESSLPENLKSCNKFKKFLSCYIAWLTKQEIEYFC
jgi:hypothetical protein